jgi:hypothetical protein
VRPRGEHERHREELERPASFDDEAGSRDGGLVALAQGIGLAVALAWLAAGRNPLSREYEPA